MELPHKNIAGIEGPVFRCLNLITNVLLQNVIVLRNANETLQKPVATTDMRRKTCSSNWFDDFHEGIQILIKNTMV